MDSIQEFRVATGNSAEFGRSAGANVNVAVKSGTRNLHGSAHWYVRNDVFDANPWFNNRDGVGKTPFKQNQYGVSLGRPAVIPGLYKGRDKTFWFFNWEGYRERRANTLRLTTHTAEMRAGRFGDLNNIYDPLTGTAGPGGLAVRQPLPNNQLPVSRINRATASLIEANMPLPNLPENTRNVLRQESRRNDRDAIVARLDHSLSAKDSLFARLLHQRVGLANPNLNPNMSDTVRVDVDNVAAGWNRAISPTSVIELKYGYNRPDVPGCTLLNNATRGDLLSKAGITLFDAANICNVLPGFTALGWFTVGGGGGETSEEINHQLIGTYSKFLGKHSLKTGATFTRRKFIGVFSNPGNGTMDFWKDPTDSAGDARSGNSIATMLLGYLSAYVRGQGIPKVITYQPSTGVFIQDDWRLTQRLTINLGLRYELQPRPYDENNALGNVYRVWDAQLGRQRAQLIWAGVNPLVNPANGQVNSPPQRFGYGRSLMVTDKNDIGPRVGLAYKITDTMVIRSGFGIFYNSTFMQETQDMRKFWPYLPQQSVNANRGVRPDFLVTDAGPSYSGTQGVGGWPQESRNRSPYSQQWNLFVQRQLQQDATVEIGYVGSSNKKQIGYGPWNNAVTPAAGALDSRRLFAPDGITGNLIGGDNLYNSEYNALQLRFTKRLSHGFQVLANYTYANCMDETSSLAGVEGKAQDQFNRRPDWGRCNFELRHAFRLGYVIDLPFGRGRHFGGTWHPALNALLGGWSLEGLTQLQTGTPSNAQLGRDNANLGFGQQRPNVVGDPNTGKRTPDRLFNTAAFTFPDRFTFGNGGPYTVHDDGRYVWDLSILKQFHIREGHAVELRGEFFNPNHINFVNGRDHNMSSPLFGSTRESTAERQIQFALRYTF
jgi:hypothetical protein